MNWRHGCRATCRQDACATDEAERNMIATKSIEAMKETDPYLAKFDELIAPAAGRHPSWIFPLRKAALSRFAELGFPTLKDEDWRFTNVAPIVKLPFKPAFEYALDGLTENTLSRFHFSELDCNRLVFVNGHFSSELSFCLPQAKGVKLGSL